MASVPFNNLITFSRGSNATLTGSNGLIQWAPNNLLTFSEQFDNVVWTKANATITANTTVAPDGTTTADTLTDTATNIRHIVYQTLSYAPTTIYTVSTSVKQSSLQFAYVGLSFGTPAYGVVIDLATGLITDTKTTGAGITNTSASVFNLGNGWYRVAVTAACSTGSNIFPIIATSNSGTPTYDANGQPAYAGSGQSILIWGAQLELGSAATTYNSTTVKNRLGFSEAFDNAAWTKTRASIVTGAQANPVNGAFNAQKLMEDTTTGEHFISLVTGTTVVGTRSTISFYAKAAERNKVRIYNFAMNNLIVFFDLTNGVSTRTVGGTAPQHGMVALGNGWYRCYVTDVSTVANQDFIINLVSTGTTTAYTGDGNSGVYIYGAQLSDSASLDPYVPTPAAAPSSTAYYGPRFDYDPVTLQPKGLLVEEARTNLVRYSEDFTNAAWVDISAGTTTRTANFGVAPDGTMTADRIQGNNVNTWLAQDGGSRPSQTLTFSVWLRANSGTPSGVALVLSVSAGGTYSTSITVTSTWTRFTFTITTAAGDTNGARVGLNQGNGNDLLIWGAQLEVGAFATSYIPTVASTVTRSADVATINGSLFSQWYGQTEGTWVSEASTFKPTSSSAAGVVLRAQDGGSPAAFTDTIYNVADINARVSVGGVTQASFTVAYTASAVDKVAQAYRTNDFAAARNGSVIGTDNSGSVSTTIDRMGIGSAATGSLLPLNGHIRSINYIPARAADFQLQALTL